MRLRCALLALLATGCDMHATPVAPSSISPAPMVPTSVVAAIAPTFTINIGSNGGSTFVGIPWTSTVTVSSSLAASPPPAAVSANCGTPGADQTVPGFLGAWVVTCAFPSAGIYTVTVTAISESGTVARSSVTVTAEARRLLLTLSCTQPPGNDTTCAVIARQPTGETVTDQVGEIQWEWGDGQIDRTSDPFATHNYRRSGVYTVTASASYAGLIGRITTGVTIP